MSHIRFRICGQPPQRYTQPWEKRKLLFYLQGFLLWRLDRLESKNNDDDSWAWIHFVEKPSFLRSRMCTKFCKEFWTCNEILQPEQEPLFGTIAAGGFQPSLCIRIPSIDRNKHMDAWNPRSEICIRLVSMVFCHVICPSRPQVLCLCSQVWEWCLWLKSEYTLLSFLAAQQPLTPGSVFREVPTSWVVVEAEAFPRFPSLPWAKRRSWGPGREGISIRHIGPGLGMGTGDPKMLRSQQVSLLEAAVMPRMTSLSHSISFSSSTSILINSGKQPSDPLLQASLCGNQNLSKD